MTPTTLDADMHDERHYNDNTTGGGAGLIFVAFLLLAPLCGVLVLALAVR